MVFLSLWVCVKNSLLPLVAEGEGDRLRANPLSCNYPSKQGDLVGGGGH